MIPQASEVDKERLEVALKRVTKDSQRRAPGVFEKSLGMFWGMKEGGKNGGMISICSKFYRFYEVGGRRKVNMDVSENSGFSFQIIYFKRVFHYFHHPFWGVSLFLETPIWRNDINMQQILQILRCSTILYVHLYTFIHNIYIYKYFNSHSKDPVINQSLSWKFSQGFWLPLFVYFASVKPIWPWTDVPQVKAAQAPIGGGV